MNTAIKRVFKTLFMWLVSNLSFEKPTLSTFIWIIHRTRNVLLRTVDIMRCCHDQLKPGPTFMRDLHHKSSKESAFLTMRIFTRKTAANTLLNTALVLLSLQSEMCFVVIQFLHNRNLECTPLSNVKRKTHMYNHRLYINIFLFTKSNHFLQSIIKMASVTMRTIKKLKCSGTKSGLKWVKFPKSWNSKKKLKDL